MKVGFLLEKYYKTREFDYWLKDEILYLNQNKYPHDDVDRQILIQKSLNNVFSQRKLVSKLKKKKLLGIVEYWEDLGFFNPESDFHFSVEDLKEMLKRSSQQFEALSDLCYRLTLFNDSHKNPLYLDEYSVKKHQRSFPKFYIQKDSYSIDDIIGSCSLQLLSLSRFYRENIGKSKIEIESNIIKGELEFLFSNFKQDIPENKTKLFADIFYSIMLSQQHTNLTKLYLLQNGDHEEQKIISNAYTAFEHSFEIIKSKKEDIVNIIINSIN
tara:strand:- start:21833 stop:22642 length:810 start_codon:yes stop_codon:yes gene_type:complete